MATAKGKKAATRRRAKKTGEGEPHGFRAETARLLHLLIHSVYSDREVFLRELVSNAADACDKLRYEAIAAPALTGDDPQFRISVVIDAAAGTLSVEDNGIGMGREELVDNLGTIARSGTRAYLDALKDKTEGAGQIGQFGVGFYAAFMVAREVEVISRRAGSDGVWRWHSTGGEGFTVSELDAASAGFAGRGTIVRLHLSDDAREFLDAGRIERIIKTYSGHVPVPVFLVEMKGGERGEPRALGDASALWRKPKSEISAEAYKEFYGHVSGQFDEPALTIHYRAEGRHEYVVLLFVPTQPPFDLYDPERRGRVRLYVRRVFITDHAELLPPWLRFVRGLVDSEDMPLNISREMLQNNPLVAQIRKALTGRVLSELGKLAEKDAETYLEVWQAFGTVLKEGLYEDPERRDELYALARFHTTRDPGGWRSLKDYVADMRPNQTAIYYLAGAGDERLAASPQLEGFRARGIEVLLLGDPVDSFWTVSAIGYDGKPFRSIAQGAAEIDQVPLADEAEAAGEAPAEPKVATLIALMKQTLGEAVADIVPSARLTTSASCLVAPQGGLDRRLERILASQTGAGQVSAPVLEINPRHALIAAMAERAAAGKARDGLDEAIWLIYDEARIAEGEGPQDPAEFCARLNAALVRALANQG